MSNNIIDKIQLSGITYDIGGQGGSGVSVVEVTQAEYDVLPSSAKTDTSKMYVITDAEAGDLTNYYTKTEVDNAITAATSTKQDTLVSGTNIKTINNTSILGSGNIDIQGGGGGGKAVTGGTNISVTTGETADTINCTLYISNGSNYGDIQEGNSSASGGWSHAEGSGTKATANYAHTEGYQTSATSIASHAEGNMTAANGNCSHTEGSYTIAKNQTEHASGRYNVSSSASTTFGDSGNTLFSVGNGTASNARHNAFEIRQNGDIYITSGNTDIKLQDHLGGGGGGGSSYTAGDGIDITNNVISVTGKVDTTTYNTYTAATDTALASKADTATTYTKTEVDTALASKQTTLTAGTGISIVDNVISATGGGSITIDPSLDSGSTNAVANSAITTAIDSKQNVLNTGYYGGVSSTYMSSGPGTWDYAILKKFVNSGNTVVQNGDDKIYFTRINGKSLISAYSPIYIPLPNLSLVETSAITTSVTSSSTDAQVPSAKAVYDQLGGLKLVKLTQAQYDALTTKDSNTLYVIVN